MTASRRRNTRRGTTTPAARSARSAPALQLVESADPTLVRLPRVRAAQKRIASGYYDRDAVRARLVNAVLEEILGS